MPFIPNHRDTCECKRSFETCCPFGCGARVVYVECTCLPPSKFYLDREGDVRHNEHGCGKMRTFARSLVMPLWREARIAKVPAGRDHTVVSNILETIEGWEAPRGDIDLPHDPNERLGWEAPPEDKRIIVERCKQFMRVKIAELWVQGLHKQARMPFLVLQRIRQDPNFSKEFEDAFEKAMERHS